MVDYSVATNIRILRADSRDECIAILAKLTRLRQKHSQIPPKAVQNAALSVPNI